MALNCLVESLLMLTCSFKRKKRKTWTRIVITGWPNTRKSSRKINNNRTQIYLNLDSYISSGFRVKLYLIWLFYDFNLALLQAYVKTCVHKIYAYICMYVWYLPANGGSQANRCQLATILMADVPGSHNLVSITDSVLAHVLHVAQQLNRNLCFLFYRKVHDNLWSIGKFKWVWQLIDRLKWCSNIIIGNTVASEWLEWADIESIR